MTESTIQLQGRSAKEMDNDVLAISFSVTKESKDSNDVQSKLRDAVHAALTVVRPYLVASKVDVQSDSFRVQPRYSKSNQKIDGYVGSASITVKGTDTATISKIASEITTMTVSSSSNSMSHEAREGVEAELTAAAIKDFQVKADAATKGFGAGTWKLGEITIHVQGNTPRGGKAITLGGSAGGAESPMMVEGGKSEVTVHVSGTIIIGKTRARK